MYWFSGRGVVSYCRVADAILILLSFSSMTTSAEKVNVGTALYARRDLTKKWTDSEAVRLLVRMIVDQLLPTRIPDGPAFVEYLKLIANKSKIIDDDATRRYTMVAMADAVGGYMNGVLLPEVKTSYYEGRAGFDATNKLYRTMEKIKFVLNTDGRGWMSPESAADVQSPSNRMTTMGRNDAADDHSVDNSSSTDAKDPCAALRVYYEGVGCAITVPVPAFDDDRRPGSVAVPFADGRRLFGLDTAFRPSPLSRYYQLAVRCTAPAPDAFRRDVHRWLDAVVAPLLARSRRQWYPALAGASRVVRAAAAAAAAAPSTSAANRPKRRADPVDWSTCDDGPDGQLPNTNVFLLVVLLSLTFTWLSLGVFSVHKTMRRAIP